MMFACSLIDSKCRAKHICSQLACTHTHTHTQKRGEATIRDTHTKKDVKFVTAMDSTRGTEQNKNKIQPGHRTRYRGRHLSQRHRSKNAQLVQRLHCTEITRQQVVCNMIRRTKEAVVKENAVIAQQLETGPLSPRRPHRRKRPNERLYTNRCHQQLANRKKKQKQRKEWSKVRKGKKTPRVPSPRIGNH